MLILLINLLSYINKTSKIYFSQFVTAKIRNQPKTTQTSQNPPKPAKNHPNQPKTTQTNQKPPKPAKHHPKILENQPKTRQTTQKVSQQTVKI